MARSASSMPGWAAALDNFIGATMKESISIQIRPVDSIDPVPSELIELPPSLLGEIGGGDIGSGLIPIPK